MSPLVRAVTGRYSSNASLSASIMDAMWFCVMVGLGESYLGAYGIHLGGSPLLIGLLSTLPPLVGALSQIGGLALVERYPDRRGIFVRTSALQALSWIPIIIVPYSLAGTDWAIISLIAFVCLYHAFPNIGGPAWNSLIGDLVPQDIRGTYFGFRNQQAIWVTVLSLIIGGLVLEYAKLAGALDIAFFTLFGVAGIARLISTLWLRRYENVPYSPSREDRFSFFDFVRRAPRSNFAKFVVFFASFNLAMSISGPYLAVYMLRDIPVSYVAFMAISCTHLIAQFLTMQAWGRISDQFGNKRVLAVSTRALVAVPFLWMVSSSVWWLLLIQFYAGIFAAGFMLAGGNYLFDAVTPQKRARCTAYMSLINAFFCWLGAFFGGIIATELPRDFGLTHGVFTPASPLFNLLVLSACARIAVVLVLTPKFREVREVEMTTHRDVIFRVTALRAISGATFSVVGAFRRRG